MKADVMAVSEIFGPTFQGEGPSTGRRAFFVRLGGCNLACSWCDTAYTWDASRFDLKSEIKTLSLQQVYETLLHLGYAATDLLVISGGEPMLQQDRIVALRNFLNWGAPTFSFTAIEIETNGTVMPEYTLRTDASVSFNVSPKLLSSGQPHGRQRITPALAWYATATTPRARFKFVITKPVDFSEAQELCKSVNIHPSRVWVMPEGVTREAIEEKLLWMAPMALDYGFNLTSRMHISLWNGERSR